MKFLILQLCKTHSLETAVNSGRNGSRGHLQPMGFTEGQGSSTGGQKQQVYTHRSSRLSLITLAHGLQLKRTILNPCEISEKYRKLTESKFHKD